MTWKDWVVIGVSLLLVFSCGSFLSVSGILSLLEDNLFGIIEITIGSVLQLLAVYFLIMLWRLRL